MAMGPVVGKTKPMAAFNKPLAIGLAAFPDGAPTALA